MRRFLLLTFSFFLSASLLLGQPMREIRGVWLTSVYNIDWPHSTSVSALNQQNRLITMLNTLQQTNINAVFFQVRPNADALYQSAYEPWSQWVTGTRGQDPGYDPLAFVIQEAHKRGIEVFAWLNPYRFENTAGQYNGLPGNYAQTHPELIFVHNGKSFFDPGNPGTTELIKNIVADLVTNYNLDGLVFDDYFYPSGIPLTADQTSYNNYATQAFVGQWYATLNRGNFRRASVNNMILEVRNTIKAINPGVIFGVSPFGIYSTDPSAATQWGTTLPAGITGQDAYNVLFCDPLAWLRDGSVDFISPQLYWPHGGSQDYPTLTAWWGQEAKRRNRHCYISMGTYRLPSDAKNEPIWKDVPLFLQQLPSMMAATEPENDKNVWTLQEIQNQILVNRANVNNNVFGSVFYSTKDVTSRVPNLAPFLANGVFSEKSILPVFQWFPPIQPGMPQIAELGKVGEDLNVLAANIKFSPANKFLMYGWELLPSKDLPSNEDYLQTIFGKDFSLFYPGNNTQFAVAEVLTNREIGYLSNTYTYAPLNPAVVSAPSNNQTICDMFTFTWSAVAGVSYYQLLISSMQNPSVVLYSSPQLNQTSFALPSGLINGKEKYVFRVKAVSEAGVSWSAPHYFQTGYPLSTVVNSPSNNATNVNLTTTVQWNSVTGIQSYQVQIATDPSFNEASMVVNATQISSNIYSAVLQAYNTKHYVRVRAQDDCGFSAWSPVNSFTTRLGTTVQQDLPFVLEVYPNPVMDACHVRYPVEIAQRELSIYGVNGQLIEHIRKDDSVKIERIDLTHLPAGFYTIHVQTPDNMKFVLRVVKTQQQ